MKFPRTIHLDASDSHVFEHSAEAEEWAVAGTFEFVGDDPAEWSRKRQLAFKSGWLGLGSFGRTTLVQVAVMPDAQFDGIVRDLAAHLFRNYGAPDMLAAMAAARHECEETADVADHPAGTLLSIERGFQDDGIAERVRVIPPAGDGQHARIWGVDQSGGGSAEGQGQG
ncbi:MAG: DUF6505 family protein [Rhodospirillaceae bacterium]